MLISRNYLPRYTVWCNLTIFSANEISKMRLSGEMIEVCFFHMGCYRNICLWFKIVFPLAGSMARYMSPIHIQPNVTISGIVCSSYQNTKLHLPGDVHSAFCWFLCGYACPPKKRHWGFLNSVQIIYPGIHVLWKHIIVHE